MSMTRREVQLLTVLGSCMDVASVGYCKHCILFAHLISGLFPFLFVALKEFQPHVLPTNSFPTTSQHAESLRTSRPIAAQRGLRKLKMSNRGTVRVMDR